MSKDGADQTNLSKLIGCHTCNMISAFVIMQ